MSPGWVLDCWYIAGAKGEAGEAGVGADAALLVIVGVGVEVDGRHLYDSFMTD